MVKLGAGEGALTGGGGSIDVWDGVGRDSMIGSGSGDRSSSPSLLVSMVISLVLTCVGRRL